MFVVCYMLNIISLVSSYNEFFGGGANNDKMEYESKGYDIKKELPP